ncbi:hypothetical protein LTS18_012534, partial [Coniosporium uncinatum]
SIAVIVHAFHEPHLGLNSERGLSLAARGNLPLWQRITNQDLYHVRDYQREVVKFSSQSAKLRHIEITYDSYDDKYLANSAINWTLASFWDSCWGLETAHVRLEFQSHPVATPHVRAIALNNFARLEDLMCSKAGTITTVQKSLKKAEEIDNLVEVVRRMDEWDWTPGKECEIEWFWDGKPDLRILINELRSCDFQGDVAKYRTAHSQMKRCFGRMLRCYT